MPRLRIGCAGYSYDDWHGSFYPQKLPKAERLAYYASVFSFVELNFSYYGMPKPEHLERLVSQVPDSFLFTIKAHSSMTHDRGGEWQQSTRAFGEAIDALGTNLGGVLLQFPYSFHYTAENRRYLADLVAELRETAGPGDRGAWKAADHRGPTLFAEFRNREWERPSVVEGMRERKLNRVLIDAPDLRGLPHSVDGGEELPTERAYLRLHGRNSENWWSGTNVTRYDYNYGKDELEAIADRVGSLQAEELFVVFNNHANAQAPLNALALFELVKVEGEDEGNHLI